MKTDELIAQATSEYEALQKQHNALRFFYVIFVKFAHKMPFFI